MKNCIIKGILCLTLSLSLANAKKDTFQQVGDVLRFLPAPVLLYTLIDKDYEGALQLTEGVIATQLTVEAIKYSFQGLHERGNDMSFAKRPCCNDWKGFPSGHAAGAVSAAGFVYYHYGFVPSIPFIALSAVTAASRVSAKKHSILQVTGGSLIAWGFAYVFTKPKQKLIITPCVNSNSSYGLYFTYKF